ncbi:MAG: polysaccharide biosynthesis protein [Flavobacteriales bacterium]
MGNKLKNALKIILSSQDNTLDIRNIKYLPRWTVLLIDTFLLACSIILTAIILRDLHISYLKLLNVTQQVLLILGIHFAFMLIFKTFAGLIRHSSYMDALKLLLATISTFGVLMILNYLALKVKGERIYLTTALILYMFFSFTLLFLFRLAVKQFYEYFKKTQKKSELEKAFIIGIDESAISVASALDLDHPKRFDIFGFASRKKFNRSLRILGKPVYKMETNFFQRLKKMDVTSIIISSNNLTKKQKNKIVEDCLKHNIKVYNSPLVLDWEEDKSASSQVKNIQIEDLLERDPIILHNEEKFKQLKDKTILVTGGAGSIGSEIVRQLEAFKPKLVLILDQAETPLHELGLELKSNFPSLNFKSIICDVANRNRLGMFFKKYHIDVIYHAAAYKHVPLMEDNPAEAVITNIFGTKNLVDLSVIYKVNRFVMVSTDKAVNPSNVMGASKRAAEMYVQARSFYINGEGSKTHPIFITTRFGNVLGSNGSVVPLFKKQIEEGGPITITHPDIIRYFMTISEACQLVLEAGAMGKGSEIFVFDMGKPVKIMDLAIKMIKLKGFIPEEDIKIKITGLRPGEKLYEELISDLSKVLPTHHKKIMINKEVIGDFNEVDKNIQKIIEAALRYDSKEVVKRLKKLIPEYKSKNSEFECLDHNPKTESKIIQLKKISS